MPRLRFPAFRTEPAWVNEKLDRLVHTVIPPKKLQTSEYLSAGSYPIIDQSQALICGWTNDVDALIRDPLPLVVFGDHTCVLKLAREPFAQGADGIKILSAGSKIAADFLFHSLSHRPLVMEEYKRHYTLLRERYASPRSTSSKGFMAFQLSTISLSESRLFSPFVPQGRCTRYWNWMLDRFRPGSAANNSTHSG